MKRNDEIDSAEKRELDNNFAMIKDAINVVANKDIVDSGIQTICIEDDFNKKFDSLYQDSKLSISVLIHGRRFLNKHNEAIMSRFNKKGTVTKWFFLDPDNISVDIVSKKTRDRDSNNIKELINKNKQLLIDKYEESLKLGSLEIYYLQLPPMQAVYIFDTSIVECKYFSSSFKQQNNYVVLYNYDKNETKNVLRSIGNGFYHDYLHMEEESKCVFSSHTLSDQQFKQYLKRKFSDFTSNDWDRVHNKHDVLDFINVQNGNKTIVFGYRYFQDDFAYEHNIRFCINQFKEKAQNSTDILFFIMGKDGTCSNPKYLILSKFENNKFPMITSKTGKSLEKFRFKVTDFK